MRQAEALGTYDRARRALVHDLGIEPGPMLRACLETILRQDPWPLAPDLSPPPAGTDPVPGTPAPTAVTRPAGDAHPEGDALSVRGLYEELLRLRGHVERLTREQRALTERLNRPDRPAAPRAVGR